MNSLSKVKLGDVVDYQTGFPFKSKDYAESGIALLRGDNIAQGTLRWDGAKFWPTSTGDVEKFNLRHGDVVLAMDRPWIEAGLKYASVRASDLPALLVQRVARLRGTEQLDAGFLRYLIGSAEFTDHILNITTGTAVPHISGKDILGFEFDLPEMASQREIAAILGALDDKIEVNRKASATLEAMARALYRSWFVDFDPVWAKLENRPPAHMPPQTAALFPDSFDDDGLPLGWERSTVEDVFDVTMGQSPPGDTYNDTQTGLPFFQGRTDFGFRFPTNRKYCSAPTRVAAAGSILLSVRAPVGDLNMALERSCIGRGVAALSERQGRNSFGMYSMWSLSDALEAYQSEGTVFGAINRNQLLELPVVRASDELINAYEATVAPMDAEIWRLEMETRTLAALRDSLLPRLMSGELRVGDAQQALEAAI